MFCFVNHEYKAITAGQTYSYINGWILPNHILPKKSWIHNSKYCSICINKTKVAKHIYLILLYVTHCKKYVKMSYFAILYILF